MDDRRRDLRGGYMYIYIYIYVHIIVIEAVLVSCASLRNLTRTGLRVHGSSCIESSSGLFNHCEKHVLIHEMRARKSSPRTNSTSILTHGEQHVLIHHYETHVLIHKMRAHKSSQRTGSPKVGVRPISPLRISLLRFIDSRFPGDSLWAWEFHPFNLRLCLSQTL